MKKASLGALLAITGLIAVVLAALDMFFVFHISDLNQSADALAEKRMNALSQGGRIALMQKTLADSKDVRAKLDSYLVGKDGVVSFLEELEKAGNALGADVKVDSVSENPFMFSHGTTTPAFRVSLEASGSWSQTAQYAEKIRSLPYRISFTRLDFAKSTQPITDKNGKPVSGAAAQWKVLIEFAIAESDAN